MGIMRFLLSLAFTLLAAFPVAAQSTFDATGQSFNFNGGRSPDRA